MRKIIQKYFILHLILLPFFVTASEDREPILQPGLKVLSPDGDDWNIVQRTQTMLAFGKRGVKQGESYIAAASLYRIPIFKTNDQFLKFVKEGRRANDDPSRFEVLKNIETLSEKQSALCVYLRVRT